MNYDNNNNRKKFGISHDDDDGHMIVFVCLFVCFINKSKNFHTHKKKSLLWLWLLLMIIIKIPSLLYYHQHTHTKTLEKTFNVNIGVTEFWITKFYINKNFEFFEILVKHNHHQIILSANVSQLCNSGRNSMCIESFLKNCSWF